MVAVAAIGVLLFDGNWLRHPLERYLTDRSHREVRIGGLHVEFEPPSELTFHLRDVFIENASWADKQPAARISQAAISVSVKSLWAQHPIISRLVLVDAELDLERQKDGLRNWRLIDPEDRSPGRVKVLSLEAHRTTIRFVGRDIGLHVTARATPVQSDPDAGNPSVAHPTRIRFQGEMGGSAFSGDIQTGERLTFLDTGESFVMRGHASAGNNRLDVDGQVADLFNPSALDAKVHLSGASLSGLRPFVRMSLPVIPAYDFTAHVHGDQGITSFTDIRVMVGKSDFGGDLSVARGRDRPMWQATLHSTLTDLADVALFSSGGSAAEVPVAAPVARKAGSPDARAMSKNSPHSVHADATTVERLFSSQAFGSERLKAFDAHLALAVKKLLWSGWPALESIRATFDLQDGVLVVKPLDLGLAGGHVLGHVTFDARHPVASLQAGFTLQAVHVDRLVRSNAYSGKYGGLVAGSGDLRAQGDSAQGLAASSSGFLKLAMTGGGISNRLDAKIGLNGGALLRLLMTGDRVIGINHATVAFDFDQGRGTSTALSLDTDQTRTDGVGVIDLHDETVDVLLTPHPKKAGLLRLNSRIRVHGPLREPKVTLMENSRKPARFLGEAQ
jgi:uncharacterized protein involved in outer membrane biogenesis